MKVQQIIFVAVSMLFLSSAQAELYFEVGYDGGGDTIAETTTGDTISAGSGLKFAAGVQLPLADGGSAIRVAGGYLFDSIDANNGDAETSTITIDALYILNSGPHSLGVGGTMHMGPEYTENSAFYSGTIEFDDAVGFLLQYGYHLSSGFEIGARYSNLTYKVGSAELDAGGIGFFLSNGF